MARDLFTVGLGNMLAGLVSRWTNSLAPSPASRSRLYGLGLWSQVDGRYSPGLDAPSRESGLRGQLTISNEPRRPRSARRLPCRSASARSHFTLGPLTVVESRPQRIELTIGA